MKLFKIITMLSAGFLLLTLLSLPATAYNIDGDLSDWGVGVTTSGANWGLDATWVPNSGTSDWIVEDNLDPLHGIDYFPYSWKGDDGVDWTYYDKTGVHIKGTGSTYSVYDEPMLPDEQEWGHPIYEQPSGGEKMDIEAMYFDDDALYGYFAIVTSMGPEGWDGILPGDLALDLDDGDKEFEYGIVLTNHGYVQAGQIYKNPIWTDTGDFDSSSPYRITGGELQGTATLVYTSDHIGYDNGFDNWVIEIKAPKSALGQPLLGTMNSLHATISCGNDLIEIEDPTWDTEIPEFPSVAVPVCAILGLCYFFSGKRRNEE